MSQSPINSINKIILIADAASVGVLDGLFGCSRRNDAVFASFPKWLIMLVGVPLLAFINAFAEEIVNRGALQQTIGWFVAGYVL